MKIMCQCGKQVSYEHPFDNFSVQRVPCGWSCRPITAVKKLAESIAPVGHETSKGFYYGTPPEAA